jgi:hypothetical protein
MTPSMTKIFTSLVGRRCCAAQDFRAERQLCPALKVMIFLTPPPNEIALYRERRRSEIVVV